MLRIFPPHLIVLVPIIAKEASVCQAGGSKQLFEGMDVPLAEGTDAVSYTHHKRASPVS